MTEIHPVADLFPMLSDDELDELAADIQERGLLHPVIRDKDGRILDGRNRLEACKRAKVQPKYVTYDGDDPAGYALAVNIARRHLTTGARAILVEQARRLTGQTKTDEADDRTNLYRTRIAQAGTILDWAKDEVPAVLAGAAFSVAYDKAKTRKAEAVERKRKLDRLAETATDLHQLVLEERMSLEDATAAQQAREEKAKQEDRKAEQQARARIQEAQDAAAQLADVDTLVATIGIGALAAKEYPDVAKQFMNGRGFIGKDDIRDIRRALSELEKIV